MLNGRRHFCNLKCFVVESLTDSACTALEKCGCDSHLGETPESFASALSARDGVLKPESITGINHDLAANADTYVYRLDTATSEIDVNNAVADNDDNHKEITSLAKTAVKNWSWRNADIIYSTEDFGIVDHRLKLYLELEVLNVEEDLVAVIRVGAERAFWVT